MNYGPQITKNGWFDVLIRQKNRWITRHQYGILRRFSGKPFPSRSAMRYSRIARRLAGGYIYSIKLEVNDYCNLKCRMCYVEKRNTDLEDRYIFGLLDQIRNCGIRLEILGGEPLLRQNINEIIRYAKFNSGVPFISLYTNGTGINAEVAEGLCRSGLDAILLTLVSHRREVHDKFTGVSGSWEQTVNGIKALVAAGVDTYSFTAVHSDNCDDYQGIYQFVKKDLGAHSLFYQYIPQRKNDPLLIDPVKWDQIKRWVLLEKNAEHALFVRDFYMISGNACSGGNFVLTVKVDGSVQPCPFIDNLPLGNIKSENIWKIFRHRFRNEKLVDFKSLPEECGDCVYASICGGGCKAGNESCFGEYNHRDIRCLGPFSKLRDPEEVMADIPTFF